MIPPGRLHDAIPRTVLGDAPAVRYDRRRWLLAAGIAASTGAWAVQAAPAQDYAPALGTTVRWPTVRLLDGRLLDASAWNQQAAVVVFFDTLCPYCRRHNRHLAKLARASRALPMRLLGVAHDRDPGVVRRYVEELPFPVSVTLDQQAMHQALSMRRVIPLTCVTDRAGTLREVIPGEMAEDDVLGLLRWTSA
jgi:peroxiredoxin